jgi:dipeptidyl aminopeptidase/acylaminoacyl peptidase
MRRLENIDAEDGELHTTQPCRPVPLPMVLVIHGGPWGRDIYGYRPDHQWLANRGYAVLSVNYRASTGFGKNFVNAGVREHAGKMHDDLIDAVQWAVREASEPAIARISRRNLLLGLIDRLGRFRHGP